MQLVEAEKKDIYCDSTTVARRFGMKHNDVARAIKTIMPKLREYWAETRGAGCTPKISEFETEYRGTKYTAYKMNRDAFVLVMMRFETKRAREWQGKFLAAFNEMERRLLQMDMNANSGGWIASRTESKGIRRDETDVIKAFVDYATAQGSKNAKHYYGNITKATYKALDLMGQHNPELRDTLSGCELAEIMLAERLIRNKLQEYMDKGRHYKDIYQSIVEDLGAFASGVRLGMGETKCLN